jgi:hypothetical protein
MYWYLSPPNMYWYTFDLLWKRMHLKDASLASPLIFVLHVPSGTLVGIVAGAARFDYPR